MNKNKYEHLLSQDPIGAFDKIKENYIRYFENAYKITDKNLDEERITLLKKNDNLYKSSYLELLPEYNSYEGINDISELAETFTDAFGSEDVSRQFFDDFIKKGLMNYIPYVHQVDMLKKVFYHEEGRYNNAVITTGTGSGKTESFLLPLFAQLFKEAKTWGTVNNDTNWFNHKKSVYDPCQRVGQDDAHKPALRALIMYPMNALVEDQMARLRKALDSDEIRRFMDSNDGLKGNRIYFGSYNGSTIGMKNYDLIPDDKKQKARTALKEQLDRIHEQYVNVSNYFQRLVDAEKQTKAAYEAALQKGNEDEIASTKKAYDEAKEARKAKEDVLYTSPRLGGDRVTAEMVTRWDMQKWAPDILITNVSMLSIMLMRKAEAPIFKQTRKWLAAEDLPKGEKEEAKKNRIFHIVLDELHLYRDTAGSETACLIRMLLNAIGLPPVIDDGYGNKIPNPQLRVLASSASLGTEDATQQFMEEFFGVYNTSNETKAFNIIPNNSEYSANYEPQKDTDDLDYEKFSIFTNDFVMLEEEKKLELMNEVAIQHDCNDAVSFIHKYEKTIFADFLAIGCKRGVNIDDLVYQDDKKRYIFKTKEALRGFLIFRAYADHLKEDGKPLKHRLPRIRFHQFFKYIEGMWGELKSTINDQHASPAQNLSYEPQEVGPHNGKVLELLRCECCGELFIGGNRKIDQQGKTYLTLNYPSLETIPNFNPTPMVQNKSFEDYALFWPSHIQQAEIGLPTEYDHFTMLNSNETSFTKTHSRAKWRRRYLDVFSGELLTEKRGKTDLIEGFVLEADQEQGTQDLSLVHALPCCCPHCNQNYTNRKYAKSPIRSFRTGIDRSNQLLSKELIYQLNEKTAKLIGFSDSRQDAAKQALGIETEHYRDMVRMLFIQSVEEVDKDIQETIDLIRNGKNNGIDRYDLEDDLKTRYNIPNLSRIIGAIYDNHEERLQNYITDTISLNNLIGHGNVKDGILLKKLVKLGINPAGPEYKYQHYKVEGSDTIYDWSLAFDYDPSSQHAFCMRQNLQFRTTNDSGFNYNSVDNGLSSAVFANSFGKYMGVSTLDAGIGYICCRNTTDVTNSKEYRQLNNLLAPLGINTLDFIDAFIRVLGDNFRYKDPDYDKDLKSWTQYSEFNDNVKKPIERFMDEHHLSDDDRSSLKAYLYDFLFSHVSNSETILDFNLLSFRKLNPESEYYICTKCGRVHPNKGFGFCTNPNCPGELSDDPTYKGKVKDLQKKHYISFDILEEPREPRRLHTEELTGQTDNIQERLLNFKDMILLHNTDEKFRMGFEATKPIDMVNVTTTMEVGVDIGSLEAIFQGNMPPTRYNYQQRVGRGGRRGQAFSTAVTFCRGRSHDVYYYKKATNEIVGGMPATPELSLHPYAETNPEGNMTYHMKLAIMKRVIVKELLNMAYADLPYNYELKDNCGEFGRVGEWGGATRQILLDWIAKKPTEIDNTVDYYFSQFNKPDIDITDDINDVKDWIKKDLVPAIDNSLIQEMDQNKGLAQCLSELGFLPMYGMPSDVRNFYHGTGHKNGQDYVKSIDRSSELAISEYAPGSEKTKDKGVYRVEALTLPMDYRRDGQYERLKFYYKDDDPDEEKDALKDRYIITYDKDLDYQHREGNIVDIKPVDNLADSALIQSRGLGLNQRLIVIPRAYRSNQVSGNSGTPVENSDRSSSFVQCQIWAKDDITNGNIKDTIPNVPNVVLSAYGLNLNNDAKIWHVNSNNNRFFRGKYASYLYPDSTGDNSLAPNFTFYDFLDKSRKIITPIKPPQANRPDNHSFEIALGSKKPTEMISLELKACPDNLNLNIWDENCNRAAVRAAFFSAAFLLQRVLADQLDVQPEEIEISDKIIDCKPYPIIYLSDALPNGAGIVSYLAKEGKLEKIIKDIVDFRTGFMKSLIDEEHRKKCRTACQSCLLTYSNRGYHHVLDWRLGVGILRLMIDPNYDFGFTEETRKQYPELADFDELVIAAAKKANIDLQDGEWVKLVKEQSCEPGTDGRTIEKIFYHPLWNKEKAQKKAGIQDGVTIEMYNTFNLLRSNIADDLSNGSGGSNSISEQINESGQNGNKKCSTEKQGKRQIEQTSKVEDPKVDSANVKKIDL